MYYSIKTLISLWKIASLGSFYLGVFESKNSPKMLEYKIYAIIGTKLKIYKI